MSRQTRRPHALVVAYNFPPHAAIGTMRTLRVVRRLAEENWDVTVVTSDPGTYRAGTPVDDRLMARVPEGVRIVRARVVRGFDALKQSVKAVRPGGGDRAAQSSSAAGARPAAARGVVQRSIDFVDAALAIPDHESGWLVPAVAQGWAAVRANRPDVLYSSAPPWTGQLVARALVSLIGCPWVADFRDPWARAPWREDRRPFAVRAAGVLERSVVEGAQQVIFVAKGNHADFVRHYGASVAARFRVVPNGCDPEEFDQLKRPPLDPDAPFVLLHAGSLYAGRTPQPLLNALAVAIRAGIIDPRRFRLRLLGTTALSDLSAVSRDLGIEEIVEFIPRVARDESLRAMMSASALLLLQPGHTISVPGKVYEYLASGRPILAIAEEGEIADLVRVSGMGVSVTPSDETAIVAALQQIMRMAVGGVPMPRRELFDGRLGAAHIVDVVSSVARGETVPLVGGHKLAMQTTPVEKQGL
ncbi:MAG: glycosyltransferase [Acidobacteria bacterium]|nr:glycosyltransferase [Acidobacteriota bacterium]